MQPRLVFQAVFIWVQEKTKIKDCRVCKWLIPRPGLAWRLTALWQPVRLHWSVCVTLQAGLRSRISSLFSTEGCLRQPLLREAGCVSNELLVAQTFQELNLITYLTCFLLELTHLLDVLVSPYAYSPGKCFGYWEGNEQTWKWDQRHH